jgi:hypothetical protein
MVLYSSGSSGRNNGQWQQQMAAAMGAAKGSRAETARQIDNDRDALSAMAGYLVQGRQPTGTIDDDQW